jgi:hypothetical protein
MKKTIPVFIALALLSFFVERVEACSCASGETLCDAYQKASAIFVGITLSDVPASSQHEVYALGKGKETVTWQEKLFRFSIEQSFKGIEGTEVEVQTGLDGGDCGYGFKKGERYLVYARFDSKTNRYHTSICSRTRLYSGASEDLDFLRGLPDSATSTRISGTIRHYTNETNKGGYRISRPMSGIKVLITGQGQTVQAITNDDGVYQVVGLQPGTYKVKAEAPANLSGKELEIKLTVGGCAAANILIQSDGQISGRITNNQGQAIGHAKVRLIPVAAEKSQNSTSGLLLSKSEYTDQDGRYKFQELPPGKYYLGVNIDEEPRGSWPYPKTYFPGTPDQDKATVIVIEEGEKLTEYSISLPQALPITTIEGAFLWSDGSPVNPGNISCTDLAQKGGKFYGGGEVDKQGRFRFDSLAGKECWIHGSTYSTVNGTMEFVNIEPVKILVTEGMKPLKLIATVPPKTTDETRKKKEP